MEGDQWGILNVGDGKKKTEVNGGRKSGEVRGGYMEW